MAAMLPAFAHNTAAHEVTSFIFVDLGESIYAKGDPAQATICPFCTSPVALDSSRRSATDPQ